jgi:hypothetical protein
MRFRLDGGSHEQDGVVYEKGDVIESPYDLRQVFKMKFTLLPEETPVTTRQKSVALPPMQKPAEVKEPAPAKKEK